MSRDRVMHILTAFSIGYRSSYTFNILTTYLVRDFSLIWDFSFVWDFNFILFAILGQKIYSTIPTA